MNSGCNFKTAVRFRPPPLTLNKLNMPNMSYCRFENTARALQDCVNAIQDNEVNNLSTYEVNGLAELQLLAMDIVSMQDEIGEIIDSNKERFVTN